MFLLNNRDRILKYKSEVIQVNPAITATVAAMAGCTIEHIQLAVERYFPSEDTPQLSMQERIAIKSKEIKQQ